MDTYIFYGHLYPSNQVEIPTLVRTEFSSPDASYEGVVTVQTSPENRNDITVVIETSNYTGSIGNLKNSMQVFVNAIVDSTNYYNGSAVEIRLHSCAHGDASYEFVTGSLELKSQTSDRVMKPNDVIKVLHKSEYLLYALSNFRKALKYGEDRGFFCYRCVESMNQHFSQITGSEKKGWELLRSELLVDRPVIDFVKDFADVVRHGGIKSYSDEENNEILECTVKILDTFILYIDDKSSFSSKKFPLLVKS